MDLDFTLKKRLDSVFFQIINLPPNMREDMRRMWRPARELWNNLERELVECRRIGKTTAKYQTIEKDLNERLEIMEQNITFATLLT
jgi:Zn ribbon nucleic-acid-binding protein